MPVTENLSEHFSGEMGRLIGPDFPNHLALAVSGGGDSMAMLALAHAWARPMGVQLWVVTVDHGLREESADEAKMVAQECEALALPHATLKWNWDGQGNVQDAARRARIGLIDRWRRGIEHVLFAHTQDDVAETLLMRLARGSGLEGLASMSDKQRIVRRSIPLPEPDLRDGKTHKERPVETLSSSQGFWQIRPLVSVSRADLRHYVKTLKVPYVDDPSNTDPRFDRVRVRQAIETLGLDRQRLTKTANQLRRSEKAVTARARDVAQKVARLDVWPDLPTGDILFDRDTFATVELDTQLRLLAAALMWVSSADYRPRVTPLEALLDRILGGGGGTLHGCQVFVDARDIRIAREYQAVKDLRVVLRGPTTWDTRWHIASEQYEGHVVRALGPDGLAQLENTPNNPPPEAALWSRPALFDENRLIACDLTSLGPHFQASLAEPQGLFDAAPYSR